MLRLLVIGVLLAVCLPVSMPAQSDSSNTPLVFPGANSRQTYFSIHNIPAAHEISLGEGVRVGILDHSFGHGSHDGLYKGGKDFVGEQGIGSLAGNSHHGYWMALVLREIAPRVQIYALNTASRDERTTVDAMAGRWPLRTAS